MSRLHTDLLKRDPWLRGLNEEQIESGSEVEFRPEATMVSYNPAATAPTAAGTTLLFSNPHTNDTKTRVETQALVKQSPSNPKLEALEECLEIILGRIDYNQTKIAILQNPQVPTSDKMQCISDTFNYTSAKTQLIDPNFVNTFIAGLIEDRDAYLDLKNLLQGDLNSIEADIIDKLYFEVTWMFDSNILIEKKKRQHQSSQARFALLHHENFEIVHLRELQKILAPFISNTFREFQKLLGTKSESILSGINLLSLYERYADFVGTTLEKPMELMQKMVQKEGLTHFHPEWYKAAEKLVVFRDKIDFVIQSAMSKKADFQYTSEIFLPNLRKTHADLFNLKLKVEDLLKRIKQQESIIKRKKTGVVPAEKVPPANIATVMNTATAAGPATAAAAAEASSRTSPKTNTLSRAKLPPKVIRTEEDNPFEASATVVLTAAHTATTVATAATAATVSKLGTAETQQLQALFNHLTDDQRETFKNLFRKDTPHQRYDVTLTEFMSLIQGTRVAGSGTIVGGLGGEITRSGGGSHFCSKLPNTYRVWEQRTRKNLRGYFDMPMVKDGNFVPHGTTHSSKILPLTARKFCIRLLERSGFTPERLVAAGIEFSLNIDERIRRKAPKKT